MPPIRTPFQIPSLIEVKLQAKAIDLPEREAEKFWYYHDGGGWRVGRAPMRRWKSALQTWKFNYEERGGGAQRGEGQKDMSNVQRMQLNDEFKRCMEKMKTIRGQYGDHQNWAANDLRDFQRIKARWKELKAVLGIKE
jgi:hypothetical protein